MTVRPTAPARLRALRAALAALAAAGPLPAAGAPRRGRRSGPRADGDRL